MSTHSGDQAVTLDDLPLFLDALREMARRLPVREGHAQSVQTDDLMQSAFRRQIAYMQKHFGEVRWSNRDQFFAYMHNQMEKVLVDRGRKRQRRRQVQFETVDDYFGQAEQDIELMATLAEALASLGEDLANTVRFRYYERLTNGEIARIMNVSQRTVERRMKQAFVILKRKLRDLCSHN